MAYSKSISIKEGCAKLRMCLRHFDACIMSIKAQGMSAEDEAALVERVELLQDDVALLIRDLRALKEPGA